MADTTPIETAEERRSAVRPRITYWAVGAYLALSATVIIALVAKDKFDLALGVLGSVGALAGPIVGFWFGSRKTESPPA